MDGGAIRLQGRRVATAALLALAVSFAVVVSTADGASGLAGRVGGDFPAFYGAGEIVASGRLINLYDPALQAQVQRGLHPDRPGFFYFPYPPAVAALYGPVSQVPYVTAYTVHSLFMVGALALGL